MRQQIQLVANGEVRIVVEGKKPDRHNLVLKKSMFPLVASKLTFSEVFHSFLSIDTVA